MTMEYRMVCARFGQDGHQLHRFVKVNRHSAEQSVTDANHKAEVESGSYPIYKMCAPYNIEAREVSEWGDATDDD